MSEAEALRLPAATGDRLARRNVLVLAAAGALAGANASVIFATGAIVGSMLAPDPDWRRCRFLFSWSEWPLARCPPA